MSLGFQIVLDFGFEILDVTYYSPPIVLVSRCQMLDARRESRIENPVF